MSSATMEGWDRDETLDEAQKRAHEEGLCLCGHVLDHSKDEQCRHCRKDPWRYRQAAEKIMAGSRNGGPCDALDRLAEDGRCECGWCVAVATEEE